MKKRRQTVLWMNLMLALLLCACGAKNDRPQETIVDSAIPEMQLETIINNLEETKTVPDSDGKKLTIEDPAGVEMQSNSAESERDQDNEMEKVSGKNSETELPILLPITSLPIATESSKPKPSATEPTESKPSATEPMESKPSATEPTESKPSAVQPTESTTSVTQPTEEMPSDTEQQLPTLGENDLIIS